MKKMLALTLLLLLLSSCAAPAEKNAPAAPEETPVETVPVEEPPAGTDETEDHILLTLEAPLADGRTLTLEAFGKRTGEYSFGVREVRVYDGEDLLQTIAAREAIEPE